MRPPVAPGAEMAGQSALSARPDAPDASAEWDNERWLVSLTSGGPDQAEALRRLHGLLLRAARFEASRRRPIVRDIAEVEVNDLTVQAADDALVAVLDRLHTFRGLSRFTTWAYKFAVYETGVKLRRRAWRDREVSLEPQSWELFPDSSFDPHEQAVVNELTEVLRDGVQRVLSPHQREVFVALALNGVPIDVLAERLGTTRGALYKSLHDARRKLRAHLADRGLQPGRRGEKEAQ